MIILFKNFYTSCHYNFENDRCSFYFKLEIDSSSNCKRIRESETKFVLSIIKRQIRRRDFFFLVFSQKLVNRDQRWIKNSSMIKIFLQIRKNCEKSAICLRNWKNYLVFTLERQKKVEAKAKWRIKWLRMIMYVINWLQIKNEKLKRVCEKLRKITNECEKLKNVNEWLRTKNWKMLTNDWKWWRMNEKYLRIIKNDDEWLRMNKSCI
jgi:hypothetical protein